LKFVFEFVGELPKAFFVSVGKINDPDKTGSEGLGSSVGVSEA
jgi:hypothetical protein